jgi:hypothetical protein
MFPRVVVVVVVLLLVVGLAFVDIAAIVEFVGVGGGSGRPTASHAALTWHESRADRVVKKKKLLVVVVVVVVVACRCGTTTTC